MSDEELNGKATAGNDNPFSKTVPLALTIHLLGVSRQVKKARTNSTAVLGEDEFGEEEVDHRGDLVTVSKRILECVEYYNLQRHAGAMRQYMRRMEVPGGKMLFRSGTYPVPIPLVQQVDEKITAMVQEFYKLVQLFLEAYPRRVEESLARLGSQQILGEEYDLSDRSEYPPVGVVKQQCWARYEWISFGPSGTLMGISKELYEREAKKAERTWSAATQEVQTAMRAVFQQLVNGMVDALAPGKGDGKKKVLREGVLTNMKDFLGVFDAKNITNDVELRDLVDKARRILADPTTDLETLRSSDATRKITAARIAEIKKATDKIAAPAQMRMIQLED